MSKSAYMKRVWSKLVPDDPISEEAIRAIPPGEVVMIRWSRPRNVKFHRKFFALLKAGFELQDHFDNLEAFRFWLTIKAGFFDIVQAPDGKIMFIPKSISFAKMSEDEFEALYNHIIDILITEFGVTREDVERVLEFA